MGEGGDAGPIYTEKQKEYVAGIKEEHLRDHLLHHIRLSDLMTKDRDKALNSNYELEDQVMRLRAKLRECCELIGIKTD